MFLRTHTAVRKECAPNCIGELQDAADAEEVAQESILKAFRNLKSFRGESRFATWLVCITQNEARLKLRKDGEACGNASSNNKTKRAGLRYKGIW